LNAFVGFGSNNTTTNKGVIHNGNDINSMSTTDIIGILIKKGLDSNK
jgi:hypothetical protein